MLFDCSQSVCCGWCTESHTTTTRVDSCNNLTAYESNDACLLLEGGQQQQHNNSDNNNATCQAAGGCSCCVNNLSRRSANQTWPNPTFSSIASNQFDSTSTAAPFSSLCQPIPTVTPFRQFSSVPPIDATKASSSSSTSTEEDEEAKAKAEKKRLDDEPNLLLDNMGKIFFGIVASIVAVLIRSSKSNSNKKKIETSIEETSCLDPVEIEDARLANQDLTPQIYEGVISSIYDHFPKHEATYSEFIGAVVGGMKKGKFQNVVGFTVQMGHLFDRVIFKILESGRYAVDTNGDTVPVAVVVEGETATKKKIDEDQKLPILLLCVALSMGLYSTVDERIDSLYKVLQKAEGLSFEDENVSEAAVGELVEHLRQTCQLSSDQQVIEDGPKYPIQEWKIGAGPELVTRSRMLRDGVNYVEGTVNEITGDQGSVVSREQFAMIIKSRAVGAWGECFDGYRRF
jgi:hypothetical protein